MWLFIRKWWVLKRLRKEILRHTVKNPIERVSLGDTVLLTKQFFIAGRSDLTEYPGIAEISVKRFSKILWWKKRVDQTKLKKRMSEYYGMYNSLEKEGYITMEKTQIGLDMPSVANPLADSIHGWFGLLQGVLSKYYLAWIIIIIPLLTGTYGPPLIRNLIHMISAKIGL